jgi:protein-S-isoprenylcysteine O-methyltransferase Ste14
MALLTYYLVYFLIGFVLPSVLVYRHTGINPLRHPTDDTVRGYVEKTLRGNALLIPLAVFLDATNSSAHGSFGTITELQQPWLHLLGWFMLLLSLVWLLIAQVNMGSSWRIGIDTKNSTPLVTTGLFKLSRNPIFLAIRVNMVGLFFVTPNALTLTITVSCELLIEIQVRLEEAHLRTLHAENYTLYAARVRRWL